MKLPILLILYTLYFILYTPLPVSAAANPNSIIDTQEDASAPEAASWGEDIIIKGSVDASGNVTLPNGPINVGPQVNQLQFPNLNEIKEGISQALPNLLPNNLLSDLKLPDPSPFPGKIFHPVCGVKGQEKPISGDTPSSQATDIKTPPEWPVILGATKLAQAIGVPGFSSAVHFDNPQPVLPGEEQNAPGNCSEISGEDQSKDSTKTFSIGTTSIDLNILQKIIGKILGIFTSGEPAQIIVRAKKFIPGENEFARQTSDATGFLRGFCPESLCPPLDKINEKEETPYRGADEPQKALEYKGVAGARTGYDLLQQSLYPEGLTPLRPIPIGPPASNITPGTGVFEALGNPRSEQLKSLIITAASAFGVPVPVLAGVAWTEGVHMWGFSDEEIANYSAPGAQDPQNCEVNGCGARGPMQFLAGGYAQDCGIFTGEAMPDVWAGYKEAVNEATNEGRTTNICNIKDAIYAASKKIKAGSGIQTNNPTDWDQQAVFSAIQSWYGSCKNDSITNARFGMGFCDFIWQVLQTTRG